MPGLLDPMLASDEIVVLQDQLPQFADDGRPQRLWVVCDDATMDAAVETIRQLDRTLILRRPLTLPMIDGDQETSPLIDFVIHSVGISDLIVCGHSSCSRTMDEDRLAAPKGAASSDYHRLLQRIRRRELRDGRGRETIKSHLDALAGYRTVATAQRQGRLAIHGVFYLVESGVFTRYDRTSQSFVPLRGHGSP